LPSCLRMTIGTQDQNELLMGALRESLSVANL
jgi:histidinol-phosphate/aromatic aminotransferase/cobyric acid decarboxylase-like protein